MALLWRATVDDAVRAGAMLVELLEGQSNYRRQWQVHARRSRTNSLSQAAVARAIALYLWDSGERSDDELHLDRTVRDRVRRAIRGEKLSGRTLDWFVQAFDMSEEHEQRLWLALAGGGDPVNGITGAITRPRAMIRPQNHRTVSLFERYEVDAQGILARRRTMHIIRAVEAPVSAYTFNHEHEVAKIDVLSGGTVGQKFMYGDGLISHELILPIALNPPFATSLEYETKYQSGYKPNEIRRPVRGRCENVDIAITFQTRPQKVEFCVWSDHLLGNPISYEACEFSHSNHAHRFVTHVEQSVIGFRWIID